MSRVDDRYTGRTPTVRSTPRQRSSSRAKQARLAAIEQTAVPGRHVATPGTCHWCGFRLGQTGHANCPMPP